MKQNSWMARASSFLAGKGFYIVLLLCVSALGASGYYLFDSIRQQTLPVSAAAVVTVTPPPAVAASPVVPTPPATATPLPEATPAPVPTATPAPAPTPAVTATAAVFTWPVKGRVIRGYTVEALAYDVTMGDWRVHDGVDIAADVGTPVAAPAGGTVSDIVHDDLMGTTVVILHANAVLSACSNLAAVPTVSVGDTVRTGDIIGSVGATAIAESGQPSHLHVSMTKGGVSVDPLDYLP